MCVNICQPLPALRGGEIHEHTELHGTAGEKAAFAGLNSSHRSLGANNLHDPFLLGQKATEHQEIKCRVGTAGGVAGGAQGWDFGFCIPTLHPGVLKQAAPHPTWWKEDGNNQPSNGGIPPT